MFPFLNVDGFSLRTIMASGEVAYVENDSPGWIAQRIAMRSSQINGLMRKRYGNAGTRNSLPFGQNAPDLLGPQGATTVSLSGRPMLGSMQLVLEITTGGAVGVGIFKWSSNNGVTYTPGVGIQTTPVTLGATGLSAVFSSTGSYALGDTYIAPTPVPEIVLTWLTAMVTYDAYRKRGMNPQDPAGELIVKEYDAAVADLRDAANSKDGLFDLPTNEDADSAVTTGGPLGYAQQSPYVWTDIEERLARGEDARYGRND